MADYRRKITPKFHTDSRKKKKPSGQNRHFERDHKEDAAEQALSPERMGRRFLFFAIFVSVLLGAIVIRLIWINVSNGTDYKKVALSQVESSSSSITAKRGDILDCNGVTMATSVKVYDLILDPKVILSDADRYLEPTVAALVQCFGYDESEIRSKINDNPDRNYVVLDKNLPYSSVEPFLAMQEEDSDIAGVWTSDSYQRNYPYDTLACSVLGFMENGSGAYGLEKQYDDELTGTDGIQYSYVNSENVVEEVRKDAVNGCSIMTTIDYNVQSIAEKYMAETLAETEADTVSVLIMNPNTGEIYAMADTNNFNCNSPRDLTVQYTQEEIDAMSDTDLTNALVSAWNNFCVSTSFEPGSTFKPFTLSMGIEENIIGRDEEFVCVGYKTVMTEDIHCYNRGGDGTVSVKRAIAISCNVSLMQMAERIGIDIFCKYQTQFGFGQQTGIDLPSELSCKNQMYTAENMTEVDLETNSFGQNFSCTMVQMASAFSALVNGGYYYKPYVVKSIYDEDGNLVKSVSPTLSSRILSSDTCDFIKECLRAVVTEGTGTYAEVTGYDVAGKTGTAEKGTTEEEDYVISFIGCAPYEDPQVVCYVVIDNPNTGDHSYPGTQLFSKIMTDVLPYLNVTPVSATEETTEEVYWDDSYYDDTGYDDTDYSDTDAGTEDTEG